MLETTDRLIVVDTETTNSLDDPICYDVGFAVVDKFGNIFDRHSYVVADVFLNEKLMESAYYLEKVQQYWEEIKQGKRTLAKFSTIRFRFAEVCKAFGVKIVAAHNARFDYRSLNLTQRYLTCSKYRYFFPYGVEIWDTLKMAREVLKNDESYGEFCYNNDFLTDNLRKKFTAETIFRFITGCIDFEEAHTGLEDVLIEKDIFSYCVAQNPDINGALWNK